MAITNGTLSDDNGGNNGIVDLSNITFTNRSDVVDKNNLILIPGGSFVSTLAGDDLISSDYTTDTPTISLPAPEGSREVVFGIYNQESLDTSSGRDTIIGDVEYTGESLIPAVYGITLAFDGANNDFTSATISTGSGNDKVLGLASSSNSTDITDIVGISNLFSSEIDTGAGRDEVRGEASGSATNLIIGISQTTDPDLSETNNLIVTGNGSDKVIGVGDGTSERNIRGISQGTGNNQLITGNGNDEIRGKAGGSGGSLVGISQINGDNQIITGNGSNEVIGEADGNASVSVLGIAQSRGNHQIITDNGNDKVIGKASGNLEVISGELGGVVPGMAGISQQEKQEISTGKGADEVRGEASGTATSDNPSSVPVPIVGIAKSNSTIETGNGNDKVIGEASGTAAQIAGIAQQGSEDLIITENGNDEVIGKASGIADAPDFSALMAGIAQQPGTAGSQIITGKGNDKVEGTAENDGRGFTAGILGDLDILTGDGNDKVIASAKLFGTRVDGFAADPLTGGTVTVDTGSGNDLVKGFGQGNFDGGKGNRDVYDLSEYSKSEFTIEIGAGGNNEVNFTHTDDFGESTAFTQGFEVFRFADGELSFSDLA